MRMTITTRLTFILCLWCCLTGNTQVPYPEWERSFGGSNDDGACDAQKTPDGGLIVVGYSASCDGNLTENGNKGLEDFWILKLNKYGLIEWQKTYGGTGKDIATSVQVLPGNQGYLVLGLSNSKSGDGDIEQALGGIDWWLLVLDINGYKQKQQNYGGPDDDIPGKIIYLENDNFLLLGTVFSNRRPVFTLYKINISTLQQLDINRSYPLPPPLYAGHFYDKDDNYSQGCFAHQTSDKGLIICGYLEVNGNDFFALKLDSSYEKTWYKRYGNSEAELALDVLEAKDGGFLIVGRKNNQDWVLKTNSVGDSLESRAYGGSLNVYESPFNIVRNNSGKLITCGSGASQDVKAKTKVTLGGGIWVAALEEKDLGDSLLWSMSYGPGDGSGARRILEVGTNEYFVIGKVSTGNSNASPCDGSIGGKNLWVLKLNQNCQGLPSSRVKPILRADRETVCENTSLNLMSPTPVNGILKYHWIRPDNRVVTSSTSLLNIPKVTPKDSGSYQLMIEQNGCLSQASNPVKIKIQAPPERAKADDSFTHCSTSATISATPPSTLGTKGRWIALDPQQIIAPDNVQTLVNNLQEGENLFVWSLSNQVCGEGFSTDTLVVTYLNRPLSSANDQIMIAIQDKEVEIDVLTNDQYSKPNEVILSIASPPNQGTAVVKGNKIFYQGIPFSKESITFTYKLCDLKCLDNCSSAQVNIIKQGDAIPPNRIGFSPNDDGRNDFLVFEFLNPLYQYPIIIFNRWGKKVYENQNYRNDWDGKSNGKLLPVDTYYYILKNSDTNEKYEGSILLKY